MTRPLIETSRRKPQRIEQPAPARRLSILMAAILVLVGSGLSLNAHPGHSMSEATIQHMLSSPFHLAVLAVSGAGLWAVGHLVRHSYARRLLQNAGLAATLIAAVVWTFRL